LCVHRPEVGSVSYSEIVMEGKQLAFSYAPGPPCARNELQTVTLALRPAARLPAA